MPSSAKRLQSEYYHRTAQSYDSLHNSHQDHEHNAALALIEAISGTFGLESFLDVGAGTGRGVAFLLSKGKTVRGVEPVAAMIAQAEANGVPRGTILEASGYPLPFPDASFDAVFECGVLHHVARPSLVVSEMMRVARRAVLLSDSNRFGQGRRSLRLLKLALYKLGLWETARFVQTRGKRYTYSDGDGIAYSYSVYDSYGQLAEWAGRIWLLPTVKPLPSSRSWLHPLLTSTHVLLCALKEPGPPEPGPPEPDPTQRRKGRPEVT